MILAGLFVCSFCITVAISWPAASDKMKMMIDTDGVTDDISAISLALSQHCVEVVAIPTTHGYVNVRQASANVARTLRANKKKVPIYKGASGPLIKQDKPVNMSFFFGHDGNSDRPDAEPKVLEEDLSSSWVTDESAALALIRLTRENPGTTIVCLGPLTNVALAIKLDDNFVRQPKKLVIMGGNYYGIGNVDAFSSAEFNFYGDPEAASIVLSEMEVPISIVPWDMIMLHKEEYKKAVDFYEHYEAGTPLANFLKAACSMPIESMKKTNSSNSYVDEIAVAMAFAPEKITLEKKELRVSVELAGKFSRAQIVPDWMSRENAEKADSSRRPITFLTNYNVTLLNQIILKMVGSSEYPPHYA